MKRIKLNRRSISLFAMATLISMTQAQPAVAISFQPVSGPFADAEAWGASWGDFNNDRCPDLFVTHHRDQSALYKNNCNGTFKDITKKADVDFSWLSSNKFADQHGAAWADIDSDGDQDIFVTTGARWDAELLINENGVLRNRTDAAGLKNDREGRMALWVDYDNNRLLDLFIESRTRSWSLEQNNNHSFFDSSAFTGFSSGSSQDSGILIDLNNDGILEYLGVPEGGFPRVAFDMTTLPFRNITSNIPQVPLTVDTAIADFNGDQLNDILLVRGRIRRTQAKQFSTNLVESWFTLSAGSQDKSLRFKSPGGDLQIDMHSHLGLVRYFFGSSGYHPAESTRKDSTAYRFNLDSSNSMNHGIKAHSSTDPDDRGVYIGYNPQSQQWEMVLSNGGEYTTAYSIIRSSAAISNLEITGVENIDRPIAPTLLLNNGRGFDGNSVPLSAASQVGELNTPVSCSGVAAGDFDNDMDQDIYLVCSGGVENIANILYENRGNGQFDRVANAGGAAGPVGSSVTDRRGIVDNVTVADYDGDGKLDMFVTNGAQLFPVRFDVPDQLFRNTTQNSNRWIELDLVGTRSNADGIGAKVYATAGGKTQLREQNGGFKRWAQDSQRVHFGLGGNSSVNLRIEWPSGTIDRFNNVAANKLYRVTEDGALTAKPPGPVAPDPGSTGTTDNVAVLRAIYYPDTDTIWVRATSDLQPLSSATLTAVATTNGKDAQLGTLNWNSAQNAYQSNFKNVPTAPDCVTVFSAAGGSDYLPVQGTGNCANYTPPPTPTQTLSIEKAIYYQDDQKQWIRANSDVTPQGSAVIEATLVYGNSEVPLGQIEWKPTLGHYQQVFKDILPTPDSVILTSDGGDSVTGDIRVE